jgi:hypothetical protein
MSVELNVYLYDAALPTCDDWQRAISERGHDFVFDPFSSRDHVGFVPIRLNGDKCGFEYFFAPIEEASEEDDLKAIGDRTHVAQFILHGSELDLRAAEIAASVLASIANGVFFDPQSGSFAEGGSVFDLLLKQHDTERDRRRAEAERKWSRVTDRLCPECNARCPEYRGKCWVCGFAIGRVASAPETAPSPTKKSIAKSSVWQWLTRWR